MTDYTLFGASHANGTTLTKANVENGTDDATDTFSITAASLAGLEGDPGFTTAIANADITLFVRHIPTSVESALYSENVGAITVGGAFTPADLFGASEAGAWYDPSDLSTLWTDTAGTTAATVGDAVARMDDKSGNGNHATQATAASRPILRQKVGGEYYLEFDGDDSLDVDGVSSKSFGMAFGLEPAAASTTQRPVWGAFVSSANRILVYPNDQVTGTGGWRVFINSASVISEDTTDQADPQVVLLESSTGDHSARRNGVSVVTSTSPLEANFFPAQIGRYLTTSQIFSGNLFGAIIRDGGFGADQSNVESWLADKTGVTL